MIEMMDEGPNAPFECRLAIFEGAHRWGPGRMDELQCSSSAATISQNGAVCASNCSRA